MKTLLEYYVEDKQISFFLEDLSYVKTYKQEGLYGDYVLSLILKNGQHIHLISKKTNYEIRNMFDDFIKWYREVTTEE